MRNKTMKRALFCLIAPLFSITLLGCGEQKASNPTPPSVNDAAVASATAKDLTVSLRLTKSRYTIGEDVPVTILATNHSREGIRFSSSTSAPYKIRLEQSTPMGWEVLKIYPEASAMVLSEWSLQPGEQRTITTKLRVERDWPTYENLRLRVHLPGRPDVAPAVHIEVTPPKK